MLAAVSTFMASRKGISRESLSNAGKAIMVVGAILVLLNIDSTISKKLNYTFSNGLKVWEVVMISITGIAILAILGNGLREKKRAHDETRPRVRNDEPAEPQPAANPFESMEVYELEALLGKLKKEQAELPPPEREAVFDNFRSDLCQNIYLPLLRSLEDNEQEGLREKERALERELGQKYENQENEEHNREYSEKLLAIMYPYIKVKSTYNERFTHYSCELAKLIQKEKINAPIHQENHRKFDNLSEQISKCKYELQLRKVGMPINATADERERADRNRGLDSKKAYIF